jgi:recombination protein RecA
VKNKMAAPFRDAEFDIVYGEGISKEGDLLDLGAERSVVEKSGAWFSFNGERIGQGREQARQFLKANSDLRDKIELALRQKLALPVPDSLAETASRGKARG